MTEDRSARGGSSTSRPKRSHSSPRSDGASFTSTSPGSPPGAAAIRELAARYGIHPTKALGQNFLLDPNLAAAIVRDADVQPGERVVEVGAGFGSLTVALAAAGASVLAIEFDRRLVPALEEVVAPYPSVEVLHADATKLDWPATAGPGTCIVCANLPYNVGTSIVMDIVTGAPTVARLAVLVQREVGERLAAGPEQPHAYGAISAKLAYHAEARVVRHVPADVF